MGRKSSIANSDLTFARCVYASERIGKQIAARRVGDNGQLLPRCDFQRNIVEDLRFVLIDRRYLIEYERAFNNFFCSGFALERSGTVARMRWKRRSVSSTQPITSDHQICSSDSEFNSASRRSRQSCFAGNRTARESFATGRRWCCSQSFRRRRRSLCQHSRCVRWLLLVNGTQEFDRQF